MLKVFKTFDYRGFLLPKKQLSLLISNKYMAAIGIILTLLVLWIESTLFEQQKKK